jgi:cytochrome c
LYFTGKKRSMNKIFVLMGMLSLVFVFSLSAPAVANHGTKSEAEAMVKEAISFVKANGKDAALAEFVNPAGKFVKKDLYIFVYDMQGKILAHGQNPESAGKVMLNAKDPNGKEYVKERIEIAKTKGNGWQDYKYKNPVSKNVEQKTAYIVKYDDMIIGCGAYK